MGRLSQLPRVALVIGVQEYDAASCPNLDRVHDDVDAVSKMLETQGGFVKVTRCSNPTKRTLIKALSTFKNDMKQLDMADGCVALLYYSGHGMMDNSSNHYLLPRDWEELDDMSASLVHFACKLEGETGVLAHLTGAKAAVALFDCCRSFAPQGQARGSPAESRGGWKGPIDTLGISDHNLLLCYACSPGASAYEGHEHGHFTAAILEFLCTHETVCNAVSAINKKVFDSTKQKPHIQASNLVPFNELCLGRLEDGLRGARKGTVLEKATGFWESLLQQNKVFVCNESGEDIIVYVRRSNTVFKYLEGGAGGSLTRGSVFARLEFELSMHRLQKATMKAEQQQQQQQSKKRTEKEKKNDDMMFVVGEKGAYITVILEKDPSRIFCIEREVPCGHRLIVGNSTFLDSLIKY